MAVNDCDHEPDAEPEPERTVLMGFVVSWMHDELCSDGEVHAVRSFRTFLGASHGTVALASLASKRWWDAMKKRHVSVWEDLID